jgi:hypothetical protein
MITRKPCYSKQNHSFIYWAGAFRRFAAGGAGREDESASIVLQLGTTLGWQNSVGRGKGMSGGIFLGSEEFHCPAAYG